MEAALGGAWASAGQRPFAVAPQCRGAAAPYGRDAISFRNATAPVRVYSGDMLEVKGLQKRYGDLVAVEEVSFVARPGEMVGLLGPNGAGKTTTVSMIAGLLAPDRGEVRIEGSVVRGETDPVKMRLGLVPQEVALHDELSARENLALFGAIYNMRGAELAHAMDAAFDVAGLTD